MISLTHSRDEIVIIGKTLAMAATGFDLALIILALLLCVDWNVFKSLCVLGHLFHERLRVEVAFTDDLYVGVCSYSALGESLTAVLVLAAVLDFAILVSLPLLNAILSGKPYETDQTPQASSTSRSPWATDLAQVAQPAASVVGRDQDTARAGRRSRRSVTKGSEDCELALRGAGKSASSARAHGSRRRSRGHDRAPLVADDDESSDGLGELFAPKADGRSARSRGDGKVSSTAGNEAINCDRDATRCEIDLDSYIAGPDIDLDAYIGDADDGLDEFFAPPSAAGSSAARGGGASNDYARAVDVDAMSESSAIPTGMDGQPNFFAYALRQESAQRTASDADSQAGLEESELAELFHPPF